MFVFNVYANMRNYTYLYPMLYSKSGFGVRPAFSVHFFIARQFGLVFTSIVKKKTSLLDLSIFARIQASTYRTNTSIGQPQCSPRENEGVFNLRNLCKSMSTWKVRYINIKVKLQTSHCHKEYFNWTRNSRDLLYWKEPVHFYVGNAATDR